MSLLLAMALALAEEPTEPMTPEERAAASRAALDGPRNPGKVTFGASGHAKGFLIGLFPYEHPLFPEHPEGSGAADGRLNLTLGVGEWLRFDAAHAITASIGTPSAGGVTQTGVGVQAPEAVDLTWEAGGEGTLAVVGRTDRLLMKVTVPHFDLTLGRQAISFGSGFFFTPLDLVAPFGVATIDGEYKPGVDAIRLDGYIGFATRLTAVAAYSGSWDSRGLTFAGYGQTSVGVTDLGFFYGWVRGDHVLGATTVSSAGPVGLHADVAVTIPTEGPDTPADPVFVRAVVGADGRPTTTTTVSGEVYVQSVGKADSEDLLLTLNSDRWQRGELRVAGLAYIGLALNQEITPTLNLSLASMINLTDPSALLIPSLGWSVASNAEVALGGYIGVGKRAEQRTPVFTGDADADADELVRSLGVRSEFGTYPGVAFLQLKAYW